MTRNYTPSIFPQSNPWRQENREQIPQVDFSASTLTQEPPISPESFSSQGAINREPTMAEMAQPQRPLTPSPVHEFFPSMSRPKQLAHSEQIEVHRQVKVHPGFYAAGLCVILGGVILLFVYYMALGLPSSTRATTASSNTGTVTTLRSTVNSASPTSVTSRATPTSPSFPGQHYISDAQMASSVYPMGARPLQESTIFRVNQKVYVTFQLHTGEQAGAVCFIWYLNSRSLFNYPLPVRPFQSASYSFAIYGNAGAGSVELYWASSIRCTDEVLAQRVGFTVMG